MKQIQRRTGIIEREGDGYVALCPELDIASQGGISGDVCCAVLHYFTR